MTTQTDVSSLPASRELDALVAERVMGFSPIEIIEWGVAVVPNYSTSIAAAWEVLEHFHPHGSVVLFCFGQDHPRATQREFLPFACEIHRRESYPVVGSADTAPLAICLAALQAVGASHGP